MDQQQHRTILELYLGDAPVVAQASSQRPKSTNWTTLTIYCVAGLDMGPPGTRYIAEIVGGTTKADEETRVRRAPFPTLGKALNWSMFDHTSSLFDELRCAVIAGLESGRHLPPMLIVTSDVPDELRVAVQSEPGGPITAMQAVPWIMKPPVMRCGFTGEGGLLGAVMWLYEGITPPGDENAAFDAFAADFGVDRASATIQALLATGQAGPTMKWLWEEEEGWKAFVASLRFFDREAFQANRAAG